VEAYPSGLDQVTYPPVQYLVSVNPLASSPVLAYPIVVRYLGDRDRDPAAIDSVHSEPEASKRVYSPPSVGEAAD
jgi:hypothetical protein